MKYVLKKVRSIRVEGIGTTDKGKHLATLNDLKNLSIKGSNDTEYAEGSDGARLAAFDIKKVSSIEATNGSIDLDFMALQLGGKVETLVGTALTDNSAVKIRETFAVTSTTTKITLKHTPASDPGYVYIADKNGNPATTLVKANSTAVANTSFTVSGNEITFAAGQFTAAGNVIVDYYPVLTSGTQITNDSTEFGITGKVYVDGWFTDMCTEDDVPLQMVLEKGKVSGEYDYSFGDSAATQNIKIEALTASCGGDSSLWKLYTYEMQPVTT